MQDNGAWYYLDPTSGYLKTGWQQDGGKWYLLDSVHGYMKLGWQQDGGKWYYLWPSSGAMAANTFVDGYYLGSDGARVESQSARDKIVAEAYKHIGKKYIYGATGPNTFYCSGFTQYVYSTALGINITRTTYTKVKQGMAISASELKFGDLVFTSADHVQIYIGNGQVIHAPQENDVVKVSPLTTVWKARRILN